MSIPPQTWTPTNPAAMTLLVNQQLQDATSITLSLSSASFLVLVVNLTSNTQAGLQMTIDAGGGPISYPAYCWTQSQFGIDGPPNPVMSSSANDVSFQLAGIVQAGGDGATFGPINGRLDIFNPSDVAAANPFSYSGAFVGLSPLLTGGLVQQATCAGAFGGFQPQIQAIILSMIDNAPMSGEVSLYAMGGL